MPDIQSEMSKVLQSWASIDTSTEETTMTSPEHGNVSTNLTRAVFDYIKANPGVTWFSAIPALESRGFRKESTSSMISQFKRHGNITIDPAGGMRVAQSDYAPLPKGPLLTKPRNSGPRAKKEVVVATAPTPEVVVPPAPVADNVKSMIAQMNVMQAREMYDELRTIFGG